MSMNEIDHVQKYLSKCVLLFIMQIFTTILFFLSMQILILTNRRIKIDFLVHTGLNSIWSDLRNA